MNTALLLAASAIETMLATPQMTCGEFPVNESIYEYYYNEVVRKDLAADHAWAELKTPEEIKAYQTKLRSQWVEAVGGFPEKCPLNVQITGTVQKDGYKIEKLIYESRPKHFVTAHLFLPDDPKYKAPYPGIVSACGHSSSGKNPPWYQRPGVIAAKAGFAYLVYDPIDQGERYQLVNLLPKTQWSSTHEHDRLGMRAMLVGWGTAQFRLWDGMRAIDVLASRPDVKGPTYGVMGISGGGTLSSYIMAFDDRVGAGCPAGFLTNMRTLCEYWRPQDAEQNIYGQLAFGFNHLGYVLVRAPSPVMINATHTDAFPIGGTIETHLYASKVYAALGAPEKLELFDIPGPHHWYESQQVASVNWTKKWVCGESAAYPGDLAAIKRLDVGFGYDKVDCATADLVNPWRWISDEGKVTQDGFVMHLPGARSTYDIVRDEFNRIKAQRGELTPAKVREIAQIREAKDLTAVAADVFEKTSDKVRMRRATLVTEDNLRIPTISFIPPTVKGAPVIVVSDVGKRKDLAPTVKNFLSRGKPVMVVEMRAFGESGTIRPVMSKDYYGLKRDIYGYTCEDEEVARMCIWLGRSLVGDRAEDLIIAAKEFAKFTGGAKADIYAEGRAAIPAAHAFYTARELFDGFTMHNAAPSWQRLIEVPEIDSGFSCMVHGALRAYDWTDLIK